MSVEDCLNNKHDLVEIYVDGYEDQPCTVVRWCQECGAIVVDTEYDGHVAPGAVMEMKLPKTFQKIWRYRKDNPM